jgi:hypothetical protein
VQHYPSPYFQSITPIDSDLNKVLSVIGLQDAAKDAIAKGLPTCEDLEDLFTDMADDKTKVEATFHLVFDTKIVTDMTSMGAASSLPIAHCLIPTYSIKHSITQVRRSAHRTTSMFCTVPLTSRNHLPSQAPITLRWL